MLPAANVRDLLLGERSIVPVRIIVLPVFMDRLIVKSERSLGSYNYTCCDAPE